MLESPSFNPGAQFAAASRMWMSAWLQPWSVVGIWGDYWRNRWQDWLDTFTPSAGPWLPALADAGPVRFPGLDSFLPWLPRVDAVMIPLASDGEGRAVRLKLRAALPQGGFGAAEWLTVDAKIALTTDTQPDALEAQAPRVIGAPVASSLPDAGGTATSGPADEPRAESTPKPPARRRKTDKSDGTPSA